MTPDPEGPSFDEPSDEPASALDQTTPNAAEPEAVRRQVRAQKKRLRSSVEFWMGVFSTAEGRREAWQMLAEAGTFEQRGGVSANGSYDPVLTGFHAGQKALGQHFFRRWLQFDPDGVLLMLAEHPLPDAMAASELEVARSRRKAKKTHTGPS